MQLLPLNGDRVEKSSFHGCYLERGRGVTERGGTVLRTSQHFSALS